MFLPGTRNKVNPKIQYNINATRLILSILLTITLYIGVKIAIITKIANIQVYPIPSINKNVLTICVNEYGYELSIDTIPINIKYTAKNTQVGNSNLLALFQ